MSETIIMIVMLGMNVNMDTQYDTKTNLLQTKQDINIQTKKNTLTKLN